MGNSSVHGNITACVSTTSCGAPPSREDFKVLEELFIDPEVNQDKLVAELPEWGPTYQVSFEMKINSFPGSWGEVLRVTSTDNNHGGVGDRFPAFFINTAGYVHICTQIGSTINQCKNIDMNEGTWYELDLRQIEENSKVFLLTSSCKM